MALVLTEKVGSRVIVDGPAPSFELHYILTGTADDGVAKDYVGRRTLKTWDGMTRKTIEITPDWVDTTADGGAGDGLWQVVVNYDTLQDPFNLGDFAENFDISLATEHVTHSRRTIGQWEAAGELITPDNNQAINDTGERIEGVDILSPLFRFDETHRLSANLVTSRYRGIIFHLSGTVNSTDFKGFERGECMFLGARARLVEEGEYEVHYRFAATPNRSNIQVRHITVPFKRGWDYIWVRTELEETTARGASGKPKLVPTPLAVYVERVYDYRHFGSLRIGT